MASQHPHRPTLGPTRNAKAEERARYEAIEAANIAQTLRQNLGAADRDLVRAYIIRRVSDDMPTLLAMLEYHRRSGSYGDRIIGPTRDVVQEQMAKIISDEARRVADMLNDTGATSNVHPLLRAQLMSAQNSHPHMHHLVEYHSLGLRPQTAAVDITHEVWHGINVFTID
jgi:hypothetical protein